MKDAHLRVAEIREALQYVASSDMPSQHKRLLMEVVVQALRDAEREDRPSAAPNEGAHWQPPEEVAVATHLQGKTAVSWQHADELVMSLAGRLSRSPDDVRKKATELGFGTAVDYRQAKARALREEP